MMRHNDLGAVQHNKITQAVGHVEYLQFWEIINPSPGSLALHPQVPSSHLTDASSVSSGSVEQHLVVVGPFMSGHDVTFEVSVSYRSQLNFPESLKFIRSKPTNIISYKFGGLYVSLNVSDTARRTIIQRTLNSLGFEGTYQHEQMHKR